MDRHDPLHAAFVDSPFPSQECSDCRYRMDIRTRFSFDFLFFCWTRRLKQKKSHHYFSHFLGNPTWNSSFKIKNHRSTGRREISTTEKRLENKPRVQVFYFFSVSGNSRSFFVASVSHCRIQSRSKNFFSRVFGAIHRIDFNPRRIDRRLST